MRVLLPFAGVPERCGLLGRRQPAALSACGSLGEDPSVERRGTWCGRVTTGGPTVGAVTARSRWLSRRLPYRRLSCLRRPVPPLPSRRWRGSGTPGIGHAARCGFLGGRPSGKVRVERGDASVPRGLSLAGGVVREDLVGAGGYAVDGDRPGWSRQRRTSGHL